MAFNLKFSKEIEPLSYLDIIITLSVRHNISKC